MKRTFDFLVSAVLLIVLAPALACIAVAVLVKMGRPIIFRQQRPGLNGEPFVMYKFRTMSVTMGDDQQAVSDTERLTSFGRFLRSTSLDELPEFWNVFRGDMSLVGPRPLLMEYLPLYSAEQARRHDARPGITGWAQVKGRNSLSWEEKFNLDVWYVDNQSMWFDLKILMITLWKVIRKDDISQAGEATMNKFSGSSS